MKVETIHPEPSLQVTLNYQEALDLVNYSIRVGRLLKFEIESETHVKRFFNALAEATRHGRL